MSDRSKKPKTLERSLLATEVREFMQTEVVTLRADSSTRDAIETFEEYRISGAPVVDEGGALVGVLSFSDITRKEHVMDDMLATRRYDFHLLDPLEDTLDDYAFDEPSFPQDDYSPEAMPAASVSDWMNPHIVSVAPGTTLLEVCAIMARESIHRVLVVEGHTLRGIVTTVDVIRHLATIA